jgi:hypothetical protein
MNFEMNKKQLIVSILLCITLIGVIARGSFCSEKSVALGISESDYQKLVIFSKKVKEVKTKMEEGFISSKEVLSIMGKPDFINKTADINIEGQKEIWQYWHPCYASVRYILVFNKNDDLVMFTAAQLRNPANASVYYDVDYFLEDER